MRKKFFPLVVLLFAFSAKAQTPKSYTSSEILANLQKLNVLGSVLYIAAHPDDENTRLLAYLANEKKYRTGYLSLTRGDGGQNLIGDEQGIDLGLIRTQELLAARRVDGAEQFFSRAFDFGYSKSPEEALRIWGHDKILSDVVWVIRKFKPDVIITRFPTTGEGGHGHHTASAILAEEAFDAAADPNKFPEQLKYVTVWKAKRLLWNTFNFGGTNTQNESQFKIDVGAYNPLLGKSYGEIAALSRSQHKSQGFGVPSQRGTTIEYFKTIKGEAPTKDLFDGVNIKWSRFSWDHIPEIQLSMLQQKIEDVVNSFSLTSPEKSISSLVRIYNEVENLGKDDYWKTQKLTEIKNCIEQCAGLYMEAATTTPYAVIGDSLRINFTVNNRKGDSIYSADVKVDTTYLVFDQLAKNENRTKSYTQFFTEETKPTQPYWLAEPMDKGSFNVSNQQLIGNAENQPFSVDFSMMIYGKEFVFTKPIRYKYTDPVKGEIFQPVNVVPSFSVKYEQELTLRSSENYIIVKSFKDKNRFQKCIFGEDNKTKRDTLFGTTIDTVFSKNQIAKLPNDFYVCTMPIFDSLGNILQENSKEQYYVYDKLKNPYSQLKEINYDHIPNIIYSKPASFTILNFDIKTNGSSIGYIVGAGDKVPKALEQMGYKVSFLTEKDITSTNLKQFDAIVTGVRAYNTNEWMNNVYDVLMNYVNNGGVLLTQYNTSNQLGPVKAKISPYPFNISRTRITDEEAKVNFLLPNHPALNYPNKITTNDFNGWVQERSIYHAEKIDSNYQRILSFKDFGETQEQDGSLIIANYGKGKFVYTGLALFRQLPAGVAGAYRLLANLIAPPKSPPVERTLNVPKKAKPTIKKSK